MNAHDFFTLIALACRAQSPQPLLVPAPGSPLEIQDGAGNVAMGDVNGDSFLDLVITATKKPAITILAGDGRGGFASVPERVIPLESLPGEMVLADLNRDGRLDLAVASHDSYGIVVLLNDGRGGFAPAPGSPFLSAIGTTPHNHGLQAADVDEDGRVDLVTVQSEEGTVGVMLGDGRGGFKAAPSSPFKVGPAPYPPALGDIDKDGHVDIAVPEAGFGRYYREHNSLARTVTLLVGDGKGGFRPGASSPLTVAEGPYFVALADLDGDGALDLVATHDDSDLMSLLMGDGKGGFRASTHSPIAMGRGVSSAVVLDLNRDQKQDLALATSESLRVLLGDGRGAFSPASGAPFSTGKGTGRIAAGDVDGDGRPDIATANTESSDVSVLLSR
ncbi:MAG: FG-GAP repeat domain-containing protein [Planctomycetota bacterium]